MDAQGSARSLSALASMRGDPRAQGVAPCASQETEARAVARRRTSCGDHYHLHSANAAQSTHFVRKLLALSSDVTSAEDILAYFRRSLALSHSKNLMPFFVYGSRPKWP